MSVFFYTIFNYTTVLKKKKNDLVAHTGNLISAKTPMCIYYKQYVHVVS